TTSPDQATSLSGENLQLLDLTAARAGDGRIVELARVEGSNGEVILIQALRTSERLLVRLLGADTVSAWTTIEADANQLAAGLVGQNLLLVGAAQDLQLAMSSASARISLTDHRE
ncbi:MAG TPA: hypothetical protein VFN25_03140, partial [Dokdonella sp.]|uniref:hypothetical protein n=1 Tax=Dokdonella sp. TaxID=2291710 RepID=UPI002D7EDEE4